MTLRHWDSLLGHLDLSGGITFGPDDTYQIGQEQPASGTAPTEAVIKGQGAATGAAVDGGALRLGGGDPGAVGNLAGNVIADVGPAVGSTTAALSVESDDATVMQILQYVGRAAIRAAGSLALQLYSASSVRFETALRSLVLDNEGTLTASFLTRFVQTSGQRIVTPLGSIGGVGTIELDFNEGERWSYLIDQNVTIAAPENVVHGARYTVRFQQDGAGSRLATWNSVFKFGSLSGTLSTGANAIDIFVFEGSDNGDLHCIIAAKGVHV
jgi:hypothetical protein